MPRPNETTHHQILALGSDSKLQRRFTVLDEPLQGNLRFGLLLEVLDKVAEETALKYVNRYHPDARVVTAATAPPRPFPTPASSPRQRGQRARHLPVPRSIPPLCRGRRYLAAHRSLQALVDTIRSF